MAGPSWLVDKSRIATKIKSAAGRVEFKSNPTKICPNCQYVIDNSDVAQEWPGLPKGVKFDPTDQEIISHLMAKVGVGNSKPHPFIDEFITTIEGSDGLCYAHPKNLPGIKEDGSVSHFFHRAIKAYNTGSRKRRKIQSNDSGVLRWHKTGMTKEVKLNGAQKGYKKIMVLYASKTDKRNWVAHQYHLGTEKEENDGEYVISKVFYQQDKSADKGDEDISEATETTEATIAKADPVTPKSVTPDPPRNEKQCSDVAPGQELPPVPQVQMECLDEIIADCFGIAKTDLSGVETQHTEMMDADENDADEGQALWNSEELAKTDLSVVETQHNAVMDDKENVANENDADENNADKNNADENNADENNADEGWWLNESQLLLSSQQLVEGLSICDDLLLSQSPLRDGENGEHKDKPSLSVYADLGPESLKKDIEECQNLALDTANNDDTSSGLSQLEFCSQDSFLAFGGGCKAIN